MEKQSIQIKILGRKYPTVVDSDEAAVIEEAVQTIHAKIRAYKATYGMRDELDMAIMCCLEIMTDYLKLKKQLANNYELIHSQLAALEEKLERSATIVDDM